MKTYHECLACFVNQALGSLRRCGASDGQITHAMRAVLHELAAVDYAASPPVMGSAVYRIIRTAVRNNDPYAHDKRRFNAFAQTLLEEVRAGADSSADPFGAKIALAIAANIIDSGKNGDLTEIDVRKCFGRIADTPVDRAAVTSLRIAVEKAGSILFLCDNAGEIVFDRFLIESMPRDKIICAVRGAPVINDATMDDAEATGLTGVVSVIPNGSDAPGTVLAECSQDFRRAFTDADLVIAKGQGNFETLSATTGKRIFYLLQVKCTVTARDVGLPVGSFAVIDSDTLACCAATQASTAKRRTRQRSAYAPR